VSEVERLRERAEALEADLREANVELETAKQAHAEAQQQLDSRAHQLIARRKLLRNGVLAVVFVGLPIASAVLYTVVRYVERERLSLTVRSVEGPAPALVGEACELRLEPAYFPYNTQLELSCGGQRIYGFESFGQLTCDVTDHRVTTCLDDGDIQHGGDPRVRIDRSIGRMTVDDGDHWRIELTFADAPPAR
jgi:hypothetical protein